MPSFTITYGGWYQRTTLHLSEVYNFFAHAFTYTDLSKDKLKTLQKNLDIIQVTRETGYLEYVRALTHSGIEIRYYEDGLYILETQDPDIEEATKELTSYFEEVLNPALNYLFSLGAPTPKILANIKLNHPIAVTVKSANDFVIDPDIYGEVYSQLTSKDISVYKTSKYIFLTGPKSKNLASLVETQIFFREFKDQLEKYLNIHRKVWEDIENIKEKRAIKGSQIEEVRTKLDKYQKTISLISNRLNQMDSYIQTRSKVANKLDIEDHLKDLFQYKFDTLNDTHKYVKELWKMTTDYLSSAIGVVVELKNQSTKNSINSLTIITTIGVVAGLINYLATKSLPKITSYGIFFLAILIILTWLINLFVGFVFRNMKYKLTLSDTERKI